MYQLLQIQWLQKLQSLEKLLRIQWLQTLQSLEDEKESNPDRTEGEQSSDPEEWGALFWIRNTSLKQRQTKNSLNGREMRRLCPEKRKTI